MFDTIFEREMENLSLNAYNQMPVGTSALTTYAIQQRNMRPIFGANRQTVQRATTFDSIFGSQHPGSMFCNATPADGLLVPIPSHQTNTINTFESFNDEFF